MTDSAQPSESTDFPERAVSVDEATPMPSPSAAAAPPSFTVSVPALQTATGAQATPQSGRTAADAEAPGTRLFGSYMLLQEIAEGGMGVVYRARHIELGREVALKMIRGSLQFKPSLIDRFYQEARAVALLKHPHIIQLFDYGIVDGQHFFTMYFAEGGSLYKHLERFQANPRLAVALLEKVARAVQHIHEHGVLHRDLKPANILLDHDDEPLVSDFGLAKSLEAELDLTRSGSALGTPAYMAPEQAAGKGELVSPKTDVWALGVILYEVLCGQKPFVGQSREEVIRAIQESDPSMPRSLAPRLDRSLEAIVQKCLEKEASRRYPSAGALADDLGAWLRGEPVRARPMGRIGRAWRWSRKHRYWVATGLLAAGTTIVTLLLVDRLDPDRELRAIQQALRRGEAVDLIGPSGRPAWMRWQAPGAIFAGHEDHVFAIHSGNLSLLELLREPILDRFRFSAEVRQEPGAEGRAGIYVGYTSEPARESKYHSFMALTFADWGAMATSANLPRGRAEFRAFHYYQPRLGEYFLRNAELAKPFSFPPRWVQDPKNRETWEWRHLAIDVAVDTAVPRWQGTAFGTLTKEKRLLHAGFMMLDNPHLTDRTPDFPHTGALGLMVDSCIASFRNVQIMPLPK